MATHTLPPPDFADSDLMNCLVRMVTPMRREFGCTLDVPHFLHDFSYARAIIDQAKSSRDARLREYAEYIETKVFGPRNGPATPKAATGAGPAPAKAVAEPASPVAPAKAQPPLSEEELRARMMRKYKSSLR